MTHSTNGSADEKPADVLGDVWSALDLLPPSAMPPSMTATTIEMAAVSGRGRVAAAGGRSPGAWLLAAVVVAGCFAIGLVGGRLTTPRGDARPAVRLPAREAIREIIEEEMAKQRRLQWERLRDQRRPPRPPAETPAPPR